MDEQDGQDKKQKSCLSCLSMFGVFAFDVCLSMFEILASGEALVFEFWVAEVDEEADFDPGGIQIIDDLCLVFGGNGFDGFQLDNHLFFNDEKADLGLFLIFGAFA